MTKIFFTTNHVLVEAEYDEPEEHKHLATHLIISLEGDLMCKVEEEMVICEGILINSLVPHTVIGAAKRKLLYLFDDTTDVADSIKQIYFKEKKYALLDSESISDIRRVWEGLEFESLKVKTYMEVFQKIMNICKINVDTSHIKDKRVKKMLEYIRATEGIKECMMRELADAVYLSKRRMCHLFKEETSISLNSFLTISKIWKTYDCLIKGYNLTDSALAAGFGSSSHFANTHRKMFGMSASGLNKNTEIYKII